MTTTTQGDDALFRSPPGINDPEVDESLPQRELRTLVGGCCADCGKPYSACEAVFSIFLGLKDAPRCLPCASRRLERAASELRADLLEHVRRRECYLKAWHEAERIDGVAASTAGVTTHVQSSEASPANKAEGLSVAAEWDAGDMGCGELVMALRLRLQELRPGGVIRVRATDAAAPEDLPAWCRLCGHALVAMNHPNYWIRRKGE